MLISVVISHPSDKSYKKQILRLRYAPLRMTAARVGHPECFYSTAAMASAMLSMACNSALLPGRWPLTRMEKTMVLPLEAVR